MAKSSITSEDLMNELKIIKKLILEDIQIDLEDVKLDKKKLKFNKKPIEDTKKIFDNVRDWIMHVWQECNHKKIISNKKGFVYDCDLLNRKCKFELCPLNIKRE